MKKKTQKYTKMVPFGVKTMRECKTLDGIEARHGPITDTKEYGYLRTVQYILEGNSTHIYIPSGKLASWLVERGVDDFFSDFVNFRKAAVLLRDRISTKTFCIHFSSQCGLRSVGFRIPFHVIPEYIGTIGSLADIPVVISMANGYDMPHGYVLRTDMQSFQSGEDEEDDHSKSIWILGHDKHNTKTTDQMDDDEIEERVGLVDYGLAYYCLMSGLGKYIGAFPDMMIDGFPDNIKNAATNPSKSITIGIEPKVKSSVDGCSKNPHFRSGHFRFLQSDRYKEKRGQTIFIKPTMVKGRAKTVLPDKANKCS